MKRGLILVVALALLAGVSSLNAQAKFGVGVGMVLPQNNDIDGSGNPGYGYVDKQGWLGMANVTFPVGPVGIRVNGQYTTTSHKDQNGTALGGSSTSFGGEANVVYDFKTKGSLVPYITGGVGFYHMAVKADVGGTTVFDSSDNKMGFNGGAGVAYKLSSMSLFFEARYVSISSSDKLLNRSVNFIPLVVGVRF